jgi:hypothetical protein
MTATLVHTASREADARLAIARVAAAQRVRAERERREAARAVRHAELAAFAAEGQYFSFDYLDAFCFICSRATDHVGEHTPEQIAAWKDGRA